MNLPSPQFFGDWKGWATQLVAELRKSQPVVPLELPDYAIAQLPPASKDGLFVFVTDDVGGPTPAYSEGGVWRRVADRAEVSTT